MADQYDVMQAKGVEDRDHVIAHELKGVVPWPVAASVSAQIKVHHPE
jgi:hypothetical protein